jgi:bifunctional non-homologous end joining protein LigD
MARRDPIGIRLLTRNGHDWSPRYPAIVEAVNHLKVRSCLIDGEAVACNDQGLAVFDRLRYRRADGSVFLYAFDLLELDGQDLRREPLETRKATLASLLRGYRPGVRLNEHLEHEDGAVVFRQCHGARRYRVEAARLDLSQRPVDGLAEVQEPSRAGGEAGKRRGVGWSGVDERGRIPNSQPKSRHGSQFYSNRSE